MILDINHDLTPYSIAETTFMISYALHTMTEPSIIVAVVDPGVGTSRRPLVVSTGKHTFIGPDNGIFSFLFGKYNTNTTVFHANNENFFLPAVSSTFHGRDVFAPLAAHISKGISPKDTGTLISDPVIFPCSQRELNVSQGVFKGEVVHIDFFGNIITNFSEGDYKQLQKEFPNSHFKIHIFTFAF